MPVAEFPQEPWQTGLYGKLPSQGDFVMRRLPQAFVTPWDDWLQAGIAGSRGQLGAHWERAYQAAPVWRFVLAPGCCGPSGWAGLMQPSVDRVGRYFPLTVAARLAGEPDPFATILKSAGWHEAIERAAEAAFDAATAIDALDRQVEQIGFPPACAVMAGASSDDTLPFATRDFCALSIAVEPADSPGSLRDALFSRYAAIDSAGCVWLTRGTDAVPPTLLVAKSFPTARQFSALLVGHWAEHDWEVVQRAPSLEGDGGPAPAVPRHADAQRAPGLSTNQGAD